MLSVPPTSLPLTLLLFPFAALIAIPLIPMALATTLLAAGCLLLRAVFVYAELTASLLLSLVRPAGPPASLVLGEYSLKPGTPAALSSSLGSRMSPHRRRQPRHSFSSSGSRTPRRRPSTPHSSATAAAAAATANANLLAQGGYFQNPAPAFGSASSVSLYTAAGTGSGAALGGGGGGSSSAGIGGGASSFFFTSGGNGNGGSGTLGTRDYEGIGGWRDEDEDEQADAQWTAFNRRLEFPAPGDVHRHGGRPRHRRSLTGGSIRAALERGFSSLNLRSNGSSKREQQQQQQQQHAPPSGRPKSAHGGHGAGEAYYYHGGAGAGGMGGGGGYGGVYGASGGYAGGYAGGPGYAVKESAMTSGDGGLSGHATPEEGGLTMMTKSMIDMRVGAAKAAREEGAVAGGRQRRKSGSSGSGSGSGSSGNSHRTMTGTSGGGWMAP